VDVHLGETMRQRRLEIETGLLPAPGFPGSEVTAGSDQRLVFFFLLDPAFLNRLGDNLLLDVAGGLLVVREFHQE
jgi:hypothetical protein